MWSDLLVVGETVVAIAAAWWPYVLIVLAVLAVIAFGRAGEVVRGMPVDRRDDQRGGDWR